MMEMESRPKLAETEPESRSFLDNRILLAVQCVILVVLLAVTGCLVSLLVAQALGKEEFEPEYAHEATRILSYMNREADPCEDFYEYACGRFRDNTMVSLDQFDYSGAFNHAQDGISMLPRMFTRIIQNKDGNSCDSELKMAQLYHSCLDEFASLDENGEMQIEIMNTNSPLVSIEYVHEMFLQRYSFDIYKSIDPEKRYKGPLATILWPNLDSYAAELYGPYFALKNTMHNREFPDEEVWLRIPDTTLLTAVLPIGEEKLDEESLRVMVDLVSEYRGGVGFKDSLHMEVKETIETLLNIRNLTASSLREGGETTRRGSPADMPGIEKFKNIFPEWAEARLEADPTDLHVSYSTGKYFELLLKDTRLTDANRFMQLQFMSTLYKVLRVGIGEGLDSPTSTQVRVASRPHPREREKFCLKMLSTTDHFGYISANAYMKYYTGEDSFRLVEKLGEDIRQTILTRIHKAVKNETARAGLNDYINRIQVRPAVDQLSCEYTDKRIQGLEVESDKFTPFVRNILKTQEFDQQKYLTKKNAKFSSGAVALNAQYYAVKQRITFFTFLLDRLYHEDSDVPTQYGTVGGILAHEFGHSLDPRILPEFFLGAIFDSESRSAHQNLTQCITDLYNSQGINGTISVPENYADILGATVAYETMTRVENTQEMAQNIENRGILKDFTPAELFFISFGQLWCEASVNEAKQFNFGKHIHAPMWARTNIVLSTTPAFSDTFKCSSDSKMTSGHHCKLWP